MEGFSPSLITDVISTLGVAGSLVWYLWHTNTKTMPELRKEHAETLEKVTAKYTASIESISNNFSQLLREERTYRQEEIKALKDWIRHEASCKYNVDHPDRITGE